MNLTCITCGKQSQHISGIVLLRHVGHWQYASTHSGKHAGIDLTNWDETYWNLTNDCFRPWWSISSCNKQQEPIISNKQQCWRDTKSPLWLRLAKHPSDPTIPPQHHHPAAVTPVRWKRTRWFRIQTLWPFILLKERSNTKDMVRRTHSQCLAIE